MNVIGVPVQGVVLHLEIVAGKVSWRVAEIVELVPEDSPMSRRGRDDLDSDRELDTGGHAPGLSRTLHHDLQVTLSHALIVFCLLSHGHLNIFT